MQSKPENPEPTDGTEIIVTQIQNLRCLMWPNCHALAKIVYVLPYT